MPKLKIPARCYRLATDPGIECVESKFDYIHKDLTLDLSETALIIVDPWDTHYVVSFVKRAADITRTKIAPAIEAARKCGMKVIYAPEPQVAKKYPQWTRFAGDEEIDAPQTSLDWPPLEFRQRTGRYAKYYIGWDDEPVFKAVRWERKAIPEIIRPRPEDFVVATGNHLHRLLKYHKILHLFYCGFATNICLRFRDYGMDAFSIRGYNPILLRDATTALESHDTVDDLLATKTAIRDIEMSCFSTLTDEFIKACNNCS